MSNFIKYLLCGTIGSFMSLLSLVLVFSGKAGLSLPGLFYLAAGICLIMDAKKTLDKMFTEWK